MTRYEYATIWWEGSVTTVTGASPTHTTPPISSEVEERFNHLGADAWELVGVTAAPLVTGWTSPRGGTAVTGFCDKVHYLATFKRAMT